jgi:hypothetical protein
MDPSPAVSADAPSVLVVVPVEQQAPAPDSAAFPPCRHCGDTATKKLARGLCWRCYLDASIRPLHESLRRRRHGPLAPGAAAAPACKHCGDTATKQRTRGLCRRCYLDPSVRPLYGPLLRRRHGEWTADEQDLFGGYQLPAEPTRAPPGSPEKIAVLGARAQAHVSLHHPADLRFRPPAGFHSGRRLPRYALEAVGGTGHPDPGEEEDA